MIVFNHQCKKHHSKYNEYESINYLSFISLLWYLRLSTVHRWYDDLTHYVIFIRRKKWLTNKKRWLAKLCDWNQIFIIKTDQCNNRNINQINKISLLNLPSCFFYNWKFFCYLPWTGFCFCAWYERLNHRKRLVSYDRDLQTKENMIPVGCKGIK